MSAKRSVTASAGVKILPTEEPDFVSVEAAARELKSTPKGIRLLIDKGSLKRYPQLYPIGTTAESLRAYKEDKARKRRELMKAWHSRQKRLEE